VVFGSPGQARTADLGDYSAKTVYYGVRRLKKNPRAFPVALPLSLLNRTNTVDPFLSFR
jgi:hypothetical protein